MLWPWIATTTSNNLTLQPEIRWTTGLPAPARGGTREREVVFFTACRLRRKVAYSRPMNSRSCQLTHGSCI